jgi:DNA-binding CsgD family transcriptional regulator
MSVATGGRGGLVFPQTMSSEPDFSKLTPLEHQVLDLTAEGADGGTIAGKLGLSRNLVRANVQSILQKLGVHSRLEAVSLQVQSDKDRGLRNELRRLPPGDREVLRGWLAADQEDPVDRVTGTQEAE